jgi:hypothetical protein
MGAVYMLARNVFTISSALASGPMVGSMGVAHTFDGQLLTPIAIRLVFLAGCAWIVVAGARGRDARPGAILGIVMFVVTWRHANGLLNKDGIGGAAGVQFYFGPASYAILVLSAGVLVLGTRRIVRTLSRRSTRP